MPMICLPGHLLTLGRCARRARLPAMFGREGAGNWGIRLMHISTEDVGPLLEDDQIVVEPNNLPESVSVCVMCPEGRDRYAVSENRSNERSIKISR